MKITVLALVLIAVGLGIFFSARKEAAELKPLTTSTYTFLKLAECPANLENECRIMAENANEFISFKIDYRYREILKPTFTVKKDAACLKEIILPDQRVLSFKCLAYFILAKEIK